MPRTAITVAKSHKGDWELLASPAVPLTEQLKTFRGFLGSKSHKQYCFVQIQESDGHARQLNLLTPAAHKAHDDIRATEQAEAKAAGEAEEKNRVANQRKAELERIEAHQHEIDRLNELAGIKPKAKTKKPADGQQAAAPATPESPKVNEKGLRLDGPTRQQWKDAGYTDDKYPPAGYAAKD